MNDKTAHKVTFPHLLTEKARLIAEGKYCINISEADWQSLYAWWDRQAAVEKVYKGILKQFPGYQGTAAGDTVYRSKNKEQ